MSEVGKAAVAIVFLLASVAEAQQPTCRPGCVVSVCAIATPTPPPTVASPTPTSNPTAFPTSVLGALVSDHFDGADGLITSFGYYVSANFPLGGTSAPANPSGMWEGDSGSFYRQGGWGFSGRPMDWQDKYFFRFNTRNFALGNVSVSWRYRSANFGQDGYPVEGSDAVDLWLRYQTQYNLYTLQFDRTNDCVVSKRKIPAQGWTGPSNLIANKGVYFSLSTDAQQPIFGTGQVCISWGGVKNLLPDTEHAKPLFPNLAHDSTAVYDFKAIVRNVGTKVQIQLYRAGVLVYSATDDGRSGIAADGSTQGANLDRGYFNSVTGWQAAWGLPITKAGASGFRSDNEKFWVDDFTVSSLP